MKTHKLLILLFAFLVSANVYSQEEKNRKDLREETRQNEFRIIQGIIDSANYVFEASKAYPQGGKMIDLTTNHGSLTVIDDSVIADLPFFGRSFSGGYSNTDGGMKFIGTMQNAKVEINENKYKLTIKFTVNDSGNSYQCFLEVSSLTNANLSITTANRSSISYKGRVKSDAIIEE